MNILQAVYIMAFTPDKMENNELISMCRAASNQLGTKDNVFAGRMALVGETTKISFSNQMYISTMHTPQVMQSTFGGWMKNEGVQFNPILGNTFFVHGMKNRQGRENFVLFYFDLN